MKYRLLDWLCCPSCGHDKLDIEVLREHHVPTFNGPVHPDDVDAPGLDLTHKEGTEILDGTLTCESCHRSETRRLSSRSTSSKGTSSTHRCETARST